MNIPAVFLVLYVLAAILALAQPFVLFIFGIAVGARGERRKVVAYLRELEYAPQPTHLATRIEARAHMGIDVSSLDELERKR